VSEDDALEAIMTDGGMLRRKGGALIASCWTRSLDGSVMAGAGAGAGADAGDGDGASGLSVLVIL
jgi:hypothetical protein